MITALFKAPIRKLIYGLPFADSTPESLYLNSFSAYIDDEPSRPIAFSSSIPDKLRNPIKKDAISTIARNLLENFL